MPTVLGIIFIIALIAVFIVTFLVYKKTPAPKCEGLDPNICEACKKKEGCHLNIYEDYKKSLQEETKQ